MSYRIYIFTHLKLCLATGTHNFKWVKITHVCLIWDQTCAVCEFGASLLWKSILCFCDTEFYAMISRGGSRVEKGQGHRKIKHIKEEAREDFFC